jgi:hypothetical protein
MIENTTHSSIHHYNKIKKPWIPKWKKNVEKTHPLIHPSIHPSIHG